MALCCIGGVCVPYTAVVPILLLALKWIAAKLASFGLLPDSVAKALNISNSNSSDKSVCCADEDCNNDDDTKSKKAPPVHSAPIQVQILDDEKTLFSLAKIKKETVVLKFTAGWCRPCKAIAPVFAELCGEYAAHFIEIDVDEFDDLAAEYKVSVMPTFCIVTPTTSPIATMTGSNEATLRKFVRRHVSKREETKKGQ